MKILAVVLLVITSTLMAGCVVEPEHRSEYRGERDRDHDGIANRYDRDRDGDGVRNNEDRHPDDPHRN